MSRKYRTVNLLKSAKAELGEFSATKYALLGATVTGLVFEWSPANEALLGAIGISAHEALGTGGSINHTIIDRFTTGVITGGVSFAEQSIVGVLTALSVNKFPKTFKKWKDSESNLKKNVSTASSAITALGLGSSMAVLEKQLLDSNTNHKENIKIALKTSAIVGGANFILASVISGGLDVLDRNGYENISNGVSDTAKNPLFYIGVFGLAKVLHHRKNKKNNNNNPK